MKVSSFKAQVSRAGLWLLIALMLLLVCLRMPAATVIVSPRDFQLGTMAGRSATLTPMDARGKGTNVIVVEPRTYAVTNGSATFTNVVAGTYKLLLSGAPPTVLWLLVPDTNGTISAASVLSTSTNTVEGSALYAWSAATSDARYATAAWVSNALSSASSSGSSGMFWATGGLAVGESPWQPTIVSAPAYGIGTLSLIPDPVDYADSVLAIQRNISLSDGVAFSSIDAANAANMSLEFRASTISLNPTDAVGVGKIPLDGILDVAGVVNSDLGFTVGGFAVVDSLRNGVFSSAVCGSGWFSTILGAMQLTVTNAVTLKPSNSPTVTGKDAALWWSNGVALYIKTTNSTKLIITVP